MFFLSKTALNVWNINVDTTHERVNVIQKKSLKISAQGKIKMTHNNPNFQ